MHWVIQTNIFSEEGFEALLDALDRLGIYRYLDSRADPGRSYCLVKVVPFSGELSVVDGTLPPEGAKVIVMGSYSLARVAKQHGWTPGAFLDNLDFEIQREHWGERMLNHNASITTFDQVQFQQEPFFIRPVHDTKAFTGMVIDWGYYQGWYDSLRRLPENDPVNDPIGINAMTMKTPVLTCSKKEIYSETRCWMVAQQIGGHRVVTASQYKIGTLKRYEEVRGSYFDNDLIKFAENCAAKWSPNDAYVMDIADTPSGFKIVEVNNLNSAGWYKGDLQKLVHALEELVQSQGS